MKVTLNSDSETVRVVQEGLKKTGGYCPCRVERTEDNKCMKTDQNVSAKIAACSKASAEGG